MLIWADGEGGDIENARGGLLKRKEKTNKFGLEVIPSGELCRGARRGRKATAGKNRTLSCESLGQKGGENVRRENRRKNN